MLEPNEMLDYIVAHKEQEPRTMEEMPEWLANFFADDDYDIFSK